MRRAGLSRFIRDFNESYKFGTGLAKDFLHARAAGMAPEETTTTDLGAETTKGTEGMVYDSDTGQYVPRYMDASQPSQMTDSGLSQNMGGDQAAEGVTPTFDAKTTKQYRLGDRTQDAPFTENQIAAHRLSKMSDVSARFGSPVEAEQFQSLAKKRIAADDEDSLRNALAGSKPVAGLERVGAVTQTPGAAPAQSTDLNAIAPRVIDAYVKQGKITEARAFRDFAESESGRAYAADYSRAFQLVNAGDHDAAAPVLEKLYNRSYPDGRQVKLTSTGNGSYRADLFDEKTGRQLGSKTLPAADLGRMAINALSPTKLVEFQVQQIGKRDAESAALRKALAIENARQEGQDIRDDRRDERTRMNIEALDARLTRQLAARGAGNLTATQERSNAEIDAAREMVAGLSVEDIRQRTAPTTATGRENPSYDPALARAAKLASRRKIGTDDEFDQRQPRRTPTVEAIAGKPVSEMTDDQLERFSRAAGPQAKLKVDGERARRALAGMAGMDGHSIGQYVEGKGYQVLNAEGKLVSYLRRK